MATLSRCLRRSTCTWTVDQTPRLHTDTWAWYSDVPPYEPQSLTFSCGETKTCSECYKWQKMKPVLLGEHVRTDQRVSARALMSFYTIIIDSLAQHWRFCLDRQKHFRIFWEKGWQQQNILHRAANIQTTLTTPLQFNFFPVRLFCNVKQRAAVSIRSCSFYCYLASLQSRYSLDFCLVWC